MTLKGAQIVGHRHGTSRSAAFALLATLLLTASILLVWGHFRLMDQDEVFVLQTDSVESFRRLFEVQNYSPISLDPMFYHLLGHASVRLFGADAFAVRLPSLLGFLLMQVCLFGFARRVAGERAGVLAAAVPALTATMFYGVQARPYGVLLGLAALILVCWQSAIRRYRRTGALVTLAVAVALALNTHYFAVLLLIPLCAAEGYRMLHMRRVDWPVAIAILSGMAGVLFALPFQHAAGEFRMHYYNTDKVGLRAISQSYRALLINYTTYALWLQHLIDAALAIFAAVLLWLLWRRVRSHPQSLPAERVFLVLLAAMPLFGYLLARFVTHSIEVRYVLSAIVAVAILTALAVNPRALSKRAYAGVTGLLLFLIAASGAVRVQDERNLREAFLASIVPPSSLRQALLKTPDAHLYVQNLGLLDETLPYLPDAQIQKRMVLLYSREKELRLLQHDTVALTAMHMRDFAKVPTIRYEVLRQQPGTHLLLLNHGAWEWIGKALAEDGATIRPVTQALRGDVVAVQFPSTAPGSK